MTGLPPGTVVVDLYARVSAKTTNGEDLDVGTDHQVADLVKICDKGKYLIRYVYAEVAVSTGRKSMAALCSMLVDSHNRAKEQQINVSQYDAKVQSIGRAIYTNALMVAYPHRETVNDVSVDPHYRVPLLISAPCRLGRRTAADRAPLSPSDVTQNHKPVPAWTGFTGSDEATRMLELYQRPLQVVNKYPLIGMDGEVANVDVSATTVDEWSRLRLVLGLLSAASSQIGTISREKESLHRRQFDVARNPIGDDGEFTGEELDDQQPLAKKSRYVTYSSADDAVIACGVKMVITGWDEE